MNEKVNEIITTPPSTAISIPVTKTIATVLQAMFNNKIGTLELNIDKEGNDGPQLRISCYLANEENSKWRSLTHMYTVEQLDDYNKLRELVYNIIDDYYALEDAKIIKKYNEREAQELYWEEDDEEEVDF